MLLAAGLACFAPTGPESQVRSHRAHLTAAKPGPTAHFVAPDRGWEAFTPLGTSRERPARPDFAWFEFHAPHRRIDWLKSAVVRTEVPSRSRRPLLVGIVELRI